MPMPGNPHQYITLKSPFMSRLTLSTPLHISGMIPSARTFTRPTGVVFGVAGATAAAPIFFLLPGAEERLAAVAAYWGPRWSRGFARVTPSLRKGTAKSEPKIRKGVKAVEPSFKKAALGIDRSIQRVLAVSGKK